MTKFLSDLAERIDAGGSVLVPAFSLGRAQELVGMLVDWNERTGRSVRSVDQKRKYLERTDPDWAGA